MSLQDLIEEEANDLRAMRDDLRVRVHLAKLEADDLWEDLEKRWQHVEGRLGVLADAGQEVADDIGSALEKVLAELRDGYEKMKKLV